MLRKEMLTRGIKKVHKTYTHGFILFGFC